VTQSTDPAARRDVVPNHEGSSSTNAIGEPPGVTSPVKPAVATRSTDPSLERAMQALAGALARRTRPADFSDRSLATLFELQAEYVEDVGLEAIRQARRNGADVVSATDIERGDEAVRTGGRWRGWGEAVGGIFAGAGIGTFLTIAVETHPSTVGLGVTGAFAAVGLVVTAASLARR